MAFFPGADRNIQKDNPFSLVCSIIGKLSIENEVTFATGKKIGKSKGVLVDISSGAAVSAAIELAKRPENKGKTIVALLPDTGDRNLSTSLFAD